jgi:hypothetical protein
VVDFSEPFMVAQATLLFRKPQQGELHIRNVGDLIAQREIVYGTLNHGLIYRAFRSSDNKTMSLMWRAMHSEERGNLFTTSNIEGVERVRTEKYAFILPDTIGEYLSLRQPCDLVTVDRFLMREPYALALPKNWRYTEKLNSALRRLREVGGLDRLRRKWWTGQDECSMNAQTSRMYGGGLNGCSRADLALLPLLLLFASFVSVVS